MAHTPTYSEVNRAFNGKFRSILKAWRPTYSYSEIAYKIESRSEIRVDKETVRRWHLKIIREDKANGRHP